MPAARLVSFFCRLVLGLLGGGLIFGWGGIEARAQSGQVPASSNLPLLLISTGGAEIVDEPKTPGFIQILHRPNGGRNYLSDTALVPRIRVGIELRGSSSQTFPKKSYGLEIRDAAGEDSSLALLGMPAESDWVLSASYSDKTFLRNALAYETARRLGHYAPRIRFAELVVNGQYMGLFGVTEKIKRDANRVAIARLRPQDTLGPALTGGYILKIDKTSGDPGGGFESGFLPASHSQGQRVLFQFEYPDPADLHPRQLAYIKSYVDSFETALFGPAFSDPVSGYARFADLSSFADFFLVNEYSRNVDGYRISTFLTKPKSNPDGGKLRAGPVWDFDLAWRNANYCQGASPSGWSYQFPSVCPDDMYQPPAWWPRLRSDPEFRRACKCRWLFLMEEAFPPGRQEEWIDSVAGLLEESLSRNFERWPILGSYVWPNPEPIAAHYAEEIAQLKAWMQARRTWLTSNLGGSCVSEVSGSEEAKNWVLVPNPARDHVAILGYEGYPHPGRVELVNSLRQVCRSWDGNEHRFRLGQLAPGLYQVRMENGLWSGRLRVE